LPKLSDEELKELLDIDLGVPSIIEDKEYYTLEHYESTHLTYPDVSSSTYYNVEGTAEEYNEMNEKKKKKITK